MTRRGKNSLEDFLVEARKVLPDPAVLKARQVRVIMDLSAVGLPAGTIEGAIESVEQICQIARVHTEAWDSFNLLRDRKFQEEHGIRASRLTGLVDRLTPYVTLLGNSKHRPEGYRTADLLSDVEIGRELFRKILASAGLKPTPRGDQARRFSVANIRALVRAAERHRTKKALLAAARWRTLIDEEPHEAR